MSLLMLLLWVTDVAAVDEQRLLRGPDTREAQSGNSADGHNRSPAAITDSAIYISAKDQGPIYRCNIVNDGARELLCFY